MAWRALKQIQGYWWPESDVHAHTVAFTDANDLELALKYVKERRVAVQAGGQCGVWANYLAKTFTEVWTIEPDLENYLCLMLNIKPNVHPIWAALGDEFIYGGVGLHRYPDNTGAHYVEGRGRIGTVTIDELNLEACDLIVLDIEGMEPLALLGGTETIGKFKPVLMVEDKGLSKKYGEPQGWPEKWSGFQVVERVKRDVILVPC